MKKLLSISAVLLLGAFPAMASPVQDLESAAPDAAQAALAAPDGEAVTGEATACERAEDLLASDDAYAASSCEDACVANYEACEDLCWQQSRNHDELSYCLDYCEAEFFWCWGQC